MSRRDQAKILIVHDRPDQLMALEAILVDLGQPIVQARSGKEALRCLLHQDFAVILLDVNMPGMDGFEMATLIRQRKRSGHTPIILFTTMAEVEAHAALGDALGAVDYITTPVVPAVLKTKVRVFVELYHKTERVRRHAEKLRRLEARRYRQHLDEVMERLAIEAKRNLFFVMSVDLLAIVDFDQRFVQLNPAWSEMLGLDPTLPPQLPFLDPVHPDDREAARERMAELMADQRIVHSESRFLGRDGSYRWLGWTATPHVEERLIYVFARDVTDSRSAEEEKTRLLAEERRRAGLLQQLGAASLAISAQDSVESMLQAAADQARLVVGATQALAAVTLEDDWGRARLASSPAGPAGFPAALYQCALACNRPLRVTREDGRDAPGFDSVSDADRDPLLARGWLSVPLTRRDGRSLGLIQLAGKDPGDFTEDDAVTLARLAEMVSTIVERTIYTEATEANRLKDEFLATLSHELRNPLNAMLGGTRLLQLGTLDAAGSQRALEIVDRNVRLLARLIDDLLDVSRSVAGKLRLSPAAIDPTAVVDSTVETLRPAAQAKSITLAMEIEGKRSRVWADADRLGQIVWNLVSNAIKFTPRGGRVTVGLRSLNTRVELRVKDTGEGIDPSLLPHIFERFRQSDTASTRQHSGLGLGLAIVRHLVQLHDGTVRAESAGKGQGSTFIVSLARLDEHAIAPAARSQAAAAPAPDLPALAGLRVLVVEDDDDIRHLVCATLEARGVTVLTAASVQEAIEALDHWPADVLVSDIAMPREDGYALIKRVRARPAARGGAIPALALTSLAMAQDRADTVSAGFHMHLAKPVEPADLLAAVASLAANGSASAAGADGDGHPPPVEDDPS